MITVGIVVVFLIILGKLFYIQVIDDSYKLSADNNVLRRITQYPARGIITDCHGEPLVTNKVCYDLMVIPSQLRPFDTTLLARELHISLEDVRIALQQAKAYSYYKESLFLKQIGPVEYGHFQEHLFQFPGFYVQPRTLRSYPHPIAAHALGYVGEVNPRTIANRPYYKIGDYIGISGLEKQYEEVLRGQRGVSIYLVDVHNRIKGRYAEGQYDTVPQAGSNMQLALDAELQAYGENLMEGKVGSVVAIEPSTGGILAMVSAPSYDPNLLVGRPRANNFRMLEADSLKPLFDRSIMALYPPGSTFKIVNGLIALQEGVTWVDRGYSCHGRYPVGRGVGCHNHPAAHSLIDAVRMSCNAYFCMLYRDILDNRKQYSNIEGAFQAWSNYLKAFGFGHQLHVDLPGELPGNVPTIEFYNRYFRKGCWNSLTIISLAIGQGELGTTPLEMANLAAIIANRGYYKTPHLVQHIEGNVEAQPEVKNYSVPIAKEYFDPIIEGMYQAVNGGWGTGATGWRAKTPGLEVCGKTGTAQNPHGDDHSVFIAFAPRDNPKIAIAVFVENAGSGGRWAAPIAGLMIEKYLNREVLNTSMEKYVKTGVYDWGVPMAAPKKETSDSVKPPEMLPVERLVPQLPTISPLGEQPEL